MSSIKDTIQHIIDTDRGPSFQKNEVLEGRVLHSLSPKNAVILIKGRKLVVRTFFPLQKGDVPLLKVEQVVPQKVLRIVGLHRTVGDTPAPLLVTTSGNSSPYKSIVKLLKLFLSDISATEKEIKPMVGDLQTLMRKIVLKSSINSDPNFLKTLIDRSGLTWEHKLKELLFSKKPSSHDIYKLLKSDLKGLIMKLFQRWKPMEALSREEIQGFVDFLEQLQLLNHTALAEKRMLFFLFPIQWEEPFNVGQLLIKLPQNGEEEHIGGKDIVRISFLLQMSHLGPLRADISILDKTIRGRFLVVNPRAQSLIQQHVAQLKTRFLRVGLFVQEFVCALEEIEVLESASLVEELINREEHFLSLVV